MKQHFEITVVYSYEEAPNAQSVTTLLTIAPDMITAQANAVQTLKDTFNPRFTVKQITGTPRPDTILIRKGTQYK